MNEALQVLGISEFDKPIHWKDIKQQYRIFADRWKSEPRLWCKFSIVPFSVVQQFYKGFPHPRARVN